MSQRIRPLPGQILVKPHEKETTTSYGIELPNDGNERPTYGTVVAVSAPHVNERGVTLDCPVSEGDVVAFHSYGGQEVELNDERYLLVPFDKVFAVLEGE